MAETKKITAIVGQPVQIKLQSMVGSTGYGWYLTKLTGGLGLSSAVVVPTRPGIAPVNHIFDFMAFTEGTFEVSFELRAPWRPEEAAETETFEVEIKPREKTAKAEIESALGGREFINAAVANVGAQVEASQVLKYAAPMSAATAFTQPCAPAAAVTPQTVILYAAPITSGPTLQQPGTLSAATMIAYAAPTGPSTVAVYAAQQADPCLQVPRPVQPMYAAPMMQPYAAPWVYAQPQPLYAAPTILPYAAPWVYAQPQPCQYPGPLYAAPMPLVRYAAPPASSPDGCC
jgi:hypothetical protein